MLNINNQGNIISPNGATLLYGNQIINENNVSIADENIVLEPYEILIVDEEDDAELEQIFNEINNKQNIITGTRGQFVVIGDDGYVTTKTVPNAEEANF